jgi:hypothetical protein
MICTNFSYNSFSGSGEKIENDKKRTDGQNRYQKSSLEPFGSGELQI